MEFIPPMFLSSMTESIATEVMGCSTLAALWKALENLYGAHSKSKMDDTSTPFKHATYLPIVLQIEARPSITWQELQELLLSFDSKIEHLQNLNGMPKSTSQPTANLANRSQNTGRGRGSNTQQNSATDRGNYPNSSRGGGSRGRGRGRFSNNSKPTCQVCGKINLKENKDLLPLLLLPKSWTVKCGMLIRSQEPRHTERQNMSQKSSYGGKDKLVVGDGHPLAITHIGSGILSTNVPFKTLVLKDVLLVPEMAKKLISISKLTTDNDILIEFDSDFCFVKDKVTRKVLLTGMLKDGLYQLNSPLSKPVCQPTQSAPSTHDFVCSASINRQSNFLSKKDVWHRRLGHPSSKILKLVLNSSNVPVSFNNNESFCDACQYGKSHALPFKLSNSRATKMLELIHTDLWGPAPINSNTNFKFYIHFLDDYSRFTWLYPLKQKSDALNGFTQFKTMAENQFETKIKFITTDWGGEFQAFDQFLITHGIQFHHSCPHTSAQNGRNEENYRHIVEMGLTLLAQASMPLKFWVDAFQTSVYLINRLPTPVLSNKSPFEIVYHKKPDYHLLRTFGAACFPCLRPYQTHKFQFHSLKCVNLGYSESFKGYKCLSTTGRVYISRHVVLNEKEFPFKNGFLNTYASEQTVIVQNEACIEARYSDSPPHQRNVHLLYLLPKDWLYLNQRKYVEELLRKYDMVNIKPMSQLCILGKTISLTDGEAMHNPTIYSEFLAPTPQFIGVHHTILEIFEGHNKSWLAYRIKMIKLFITGLLGSRIGDVALMTKICWRLLCLSWRHTCVLVIKEAICGLKVYHLNPEYRALAHVTAEITWIESFLKELKFP
uniref:Integrase catalytic domain-containing protein n=1 Tax=Cannabis sativa TaxID=3483 RepID=A0A803P5A9_CANSA